MGNKMKSSLTIFLIITLSFTLLNLSFAKKNGLRKHKKHTPHGVDLKNHYGASSVGSPYGPKGDQYAQIIEANPESFTPMKYDGKIKIQKALKFKPYAGYENKLNPHQIKSGDMTNIAPSAKKVITPEIAAPKLQIQAEVQYPGVVSIPTFKGMKKKMHTVTAYDKELGAIVHDNVIVNVPEYKNENTKTMIKHPFNQTVDLRNGKVIEKKQVKKNHASK